MPGNVQWMLRSTPLLLHLMIELIPSLETLSFAAQCYQFFSSTDAQDTTTLTTAPCSTDSSALTWCRLSNIMHACVRNLLVCSNFAPSVESEKSNVVTFPLCGAGRGRYSTRGVDIPGLASGDALPAAAQARPQARKQQRSVH